LSGMDWEMLNLGKLDADAGNRDFTALWACELGSLKEKDHEGTYEHDRAE